MLNVENDFELYEKIEINGYLLNEDDIIRKINGEYISN